VAWRQETRCWNALTIATRRGERATRGVARDLFVVIATARRLHGNDGSAVFRLAACLGRRTTAEHHHTSRAAGRHDPGTRLLPNVVIPNAGCARGDAFGVQGVVAQTRRAVVSRPLVSLPGGPRCR